MSDRRYVNTGFPLEDLAGYSRAVLDGDWAFVSGTTGYDYEAGTISGDVAEQARQCFRNIEGALQQVGMSLRDVVRARYMLTDSTDFETVAPIFGEFLGEAKPAATAMICGLVDPAMKIEIEVTARKRKPPESDSPF